MKSIKVFPNKPHYFAHRQVNIRVKWFSGDAVFSDRDVRYCFHVSRRSLLVIELGITRTWRERCSRYGLLPHRYRLLVRNIARGRAYARPNTLHLKLGGDLHGVDSS